MAAIVPIILIYLSLSILSFVIFVMLLHKYFKDPERNYTIHELTKLLSVLILFIFIESVYSTLLYASSYRLISVNVFYKLNEPAIQIFPKVGIFLAIIMIAHFVMGKRIDHFKHKEASFHKLVDMNKELEKKAKEMESTEFNLKGKVKELEKFTDIAKQRETEMMQLIKNMENIESGIEKNET